LFVSTGIKKICLFVCVCSLSLALPGCGGGGSSVTLVESKGKVLLDGEPLANAQVSFIPESGPVATGTTKADGTFLLTTGGRLGVAPGNCRVTVFAVSQGSSEAADKLKSLTPEDMAKIAGTPEFDNLAEEASVSVVPEKYSKPGSSGLTAVVTSNPADNDFFFELVK
jgi:hypothetical protein